LIGLEAEALAELQSVVRLKRRRPAFRHRRATAKRPASPLLFRMIADIGPSPAARTPGVDDATQTVVAAAGYGTVAFRIRCSD